MKILIVDAEDACSRVMGSCLQLCGHETSTAHDGAEALDQIALRWPDVVIADVDDPKLLAEIEPQFGNIPVILIVARGRHGQELFTHTASFLSREPVG